MRLARAIVRGLAWLVPSDAREDWRREWLAELEAGAGRGRSALGFALGAPRHALSLRAANWRPSAWWGDVRFAFRLLRRRPGFTVAAVLTLAVGIGAATAIFSVVYGVLLKPLPFAQPDGLVALWEKNPQFNWTEAEVAPGNVVSWRERNVVFTGIAWFLAGADRRGGQADMTLGGADPERVRALQVAPEFFDLLGVHAAAGRTLLPGEDVPGRHRVVVLSDRFWRSRLAADPSIVGRTIPLNGRDWAVVGIMPASFVFEDERTDIWIPLAIDLASARTARQPHIFRAIARLKPGVTLAQAQENLASIARDLEREYPKTNTQMSVGVGPLDDWMVGPSRTPLLLFFGGVAIVLLIACANVANLLIVRTAGRSREFGVRVALGAGRLRVARQLLVESLAIAVMGAAAGLILADVAVRLFVAHAPASLPRVTEIGLHPAVVAFALALVAITAILVGLLPALRAASPEGTWRLSEGGRGFSRRGRVSRLIVGLEVALAAILLVAGAATLRSFVALVKVDLGFPVEGLMTAQITLPATKYPERTQVGRLFEDTAGRLRGLAGVHRAGATGGLPVNGSMWTGDLFIETQPAVHARDLRHRSVTSGYLETLGLPFVAGRTIQPSDTADGPLVVVINRTLARRYFDGRDPLGQRIAFDAPSASVRWRTIVGVVADEPQRGLAGEISPLVYDAETQEPMRTMTIAVRSDRSAAETAQLIRATVREIDPQLALVDIEPYSERIGRVLAPQRLTVALTGAFAAVGLLLATIGVYGVASYAVATRTREVGIRLACGAAPRDVVGMMFMQHLRVVGAGLGLGLLVAAALRGTLAAALDFVPATDVQSLAAASASLIAAGLAACLVPARRALAIDPVRALREE